LGGQLECQIENRPRLPDKRLSVTALKCSEVNISNFPANIDNKDTIR
jgi:hypothetical protein